MDKLDLIIRQLESYHLALDLRQNVVTAAQNFAVNVEKILERRYVQGEALTRAGKHKEMGNADAGRANQEKAADAS